MPSSATGTKATETPVPSVWKIAGPGLIVAGTGVGAGDVVSGTVGGASYGLALLWAVALGAFFKYVLVEGIARWQLATDKTALEGWAAYLPSWVKIYFGVYLVFWTVAVSAAMANACGLGFQNLTGGMVSQQAGAILHSFVGCMIILVGGFSGFDKVMKALVGIMFASIIICAGLILQDPVGILRGLLVPTIPSGGGVYVLSVLGGVGGSITLLSYNYWMREDKIAGPAFVRYIRYDIGVAFSLTAIFVMAIMVIANQAFFTAGIRVTDSEAVGRMAETLGGSLGALGHYSYVIGFWAAVFTSLLGVWQGVPYLYADAYGILKKYSEDQRKEVTSTASFPYRLALGFITLIPIPFVLMGRPIFIIIVYTVVGSLFIPFLAATLLYLNNRIHWSSSVKRNSVITNVILVVILALFGIVGVLEISEVLQ